MINHARTLLANVSGTESGYAGYPGDEYVPPAYRKLSLGELGSVYRILYGSNPDKVFINYRTRQLMNLIHSTDLADWLFALDSRGTYDTTPIDEFFYDLFQTLVIPSLGTTGELFLIGNLTPDIEQGRSYQQWRVKYATTDNVTVIRQTPPASETVYATTFSGGLSDLVPLTGSSLKVRVPESLGSEWLVAGYARPSRTLADLEAALQKIGEPLLVRLFRITFPEGKQEPYVTFRKCWEQHKEPAYRLSGLLLAYIYRLEALRTAAA